MPSEAHPVGEMLDMVDAQVTLFPAFLSVAEADTYLQTLITDINWKQETIRVPGGPVPLPRLTAWYGDEGTQYSYSGLTVQPNAWIALLVELKHRLDSIAGVSMTSQA